MSTERPYYQTTASRTRFYAEAPDPEGVGLDDYRRTEVDAIRRFVASDSNVLVVGGVSSSTKTHVLSHYGQESGFLFYDLHALGDTQLRNGICTPAQIQTETAGLVTEAIDDPRSGDGTAGIILDEGIALIADGLGENIRNVVGELLEAYPRVIVCGGGSGYAGNEQVERIGENMPDDAEVEELVFDLKDLNLDQIIALLCIVKRYDPQQARLVAESLMEYFRIPGVVARKLPKNLAMVNNWKTDLMPSEAYKRLESQQREIWRERGLI